MYIRRPLPELERVRLQLQSPMPSNPASCILQILQSSYIADFGIAILPACNHLKGVALICHSPPQAATGCPNSAHLQSPAGPESS